MLGSELPFVCSEVSASIMRSTSSNGAANTLVGEKGADEFRVFPNVKVPGRSLGD